MTYQDWIISEAKRLKSDGCTAVVDWNQWCCFQHDYTCTTGKDPRSAYNYWRTTKDATFEDAQRMADPLSRREADKLFWRCNRKVSPTLLGKLRADLRYIGVRIGAWF